MKYYKIIDNTTFIGVITSGNFVAENKRTGWLFTSNENLGQFVSFEGQLYRDYWMQPIPNSTRTFIEVQIVEISKEDYDFLNTAIINNKEIVIEEEEEEEEINEVEPAEPDITIEYIRGLKLKEMSHACRKAIEEGFDLTLRDTPHHFSLDTQDQLNLMSLGIMAQTQSLIPYHADGEACDFYTAEEINEIIESANAHKIYHTTYHNALKAYINSLDTLESIASVEYGMEIPEEFKTDVLRMLEQ